MKPPELRDHLDKADQQEVPNSILLWKKDRQEIGSGERGEPHWKLKLKPLQVRSQISINLIQIKTCSYIFTPEFVVTPSYLLLTAFLT